MTYGDYRRFERFHKVLNDLNFYDNYYDTLEEG